MSITELMFVPQGTPGLNLSNFSCGRPDVDEFFKYESQGYQDELFGRTYYFCLPDDLNAVVAGFTVANASIFTKHLSRTRRDKVGSEVHHSKGLINYPAVLLAQLGVDLAYRGNHLGTQIIEFVADWFVSRTNKSGCRHLIVDAYDEPKLIEFYKQNGLNLFFSTLEQEMKYRNWNEQKDGTLRTRLMYKDLILLRRDSIR